MKLYPVQLKALHSPDVYDLKLFQPSDPELFGILIQAIIGPKDEPGEESFDFVLCTPRWLDHELKEKAIIVGRHYLIVVRYEYDQLVSFLLSYIASCKGSTWDEVAVKLGRIGLWEFEDYVP